MTRWARRAGYVLGAILAALLVAFLALRTPDTDRAAMVAKYGGAGSRFVTLASGARVHVRDSGGSATPMILLHGSNSSLHTWEPLKRRLGSGYRIITLDLPGHGLTGATPTHRYDTAEMVAAVDGVARALGLQSFVLAGNSMGGGVSWNYAVAHPEKVRALLLLDAGGMPPRPGDEPQASNIGFRLLRYAPGRALMRQVTPRFLVRKSYEQSVADPGIVTDAVVDRTWELLRFPGNREATVIRFERGFGDPAAAERARTITVPTLIIFGKEDRIIAPSAALSFGERIANSEIVMLDGIGHLPMEEAPDQTARIIDDFLTRRLQR